MKVWIDIENPPQVQYLLPLRSHFHAAGAETVVTARDYGATLQMLSDAAVEVQVFGSRVGRGQARKVVASLDRARRLSRWLSGPNAVDAVVGASRAAALVARRKRIPSFLIVDYEYAHVRLARYTGSTILHPRVIPAEPLLRQGLRANQLVAFDGLKEDLTFAGIDLDAVAAHNLGTDVSLAPRVLFRPPSETSHYYQASSTSMARATLAHLAEQEVQVVFSPREPEQISLLEGLQFKHDPVILDGVVPFVSLLKAVDAAVCSGGTMLREAAYLGIPAYSIFQSEIGAVDRWLEQIGRARLISGPEELDRIEVARCSERQRLDANRNLPVEIVELVLRSCVSGLEHRKTSRSSPRPAGAGPCPASVGQASVIGEPAASSRDASA